MKTEVRYGLYYGGFSILWMLIMYVTELNRSKMAGSLNYVTMLALAFFVFQFVIEFKKGNDGFISFSTVFKSGLLIGVLGGVISSIFFYVQVKFIDTNYMKFLNDQAIMEMQRSGQSEEKMEMAIKMMEKWSTPESILLMGAIGSVFISAFVAVIMAFILKKPNPNEIA